MKLGLGLSYKELEKFTAICKKSGANISHLQINKMPADISMIRKELMGSVRNLRSECPDLTVSIHAYKFNFCEKVDRVLKVWMELAKETIDFASEINAKFVNFHAGYGSGGTRIRHQAYRQALIPVLKDLVDTAEVHGVEVHLENLYPRPIHSEMRMLGDRASDFDFFFSQIENPLFKLCYDYGHGNIEENGIDILHKFSCRLGSIHAHDNDQMSDSHLPVCSSGSGTIDWDNEFDYLQSTQFSGPFILECSMENQLKSLENLNKRGLL